MFFCIFKIIFFIKNSSFFIYIRYYSFIFRINSCKHFKEIKLLRKNAEEYFRMAGKYKRVFGKEDAAQRAVYYAEAKNNIKEARLLEDLVEEEFEPVTLRAFRLLALDGVSGAEAAQELRLSVAAVYVAKSRVLARIRQEAEGLID